MCDYYMPTDKQHDSQLIDQYFMLMRIREHAIRENAVETLKNPRKHPTPEKEEAIKDALKYFEII